MSMKSWVMITVAVITVLICLTFLIIRNQKKLSEKVSLESPAEADIIVFGDFHAEIEASNGYPVAQALYSKIKNITGNNPAGSLVLGTGDMFELPPMSTDLKGIPARKILERMGMEAFALGNHEFYWTLDTINNITLKDSSLQILSCNFFDKNNNQLVYEPYKIFNKGGVKIAVIGVASEAVILEKKYVGKYTISDPAEAMNKYSKEIRDNKLADVIIGLVHDGGKGLLNTGSLFELVKKLKNFDIIYGGHSHKEFITKANGMPILHGGSMGRGFIHTRISIPDKNAKPEFSNKYVSISDVEGDANLVEIDEEIDKIIQQAKIETNNKYSEVIGHTSERITISQRMEPYGESEIGNWVTDVIKEKTGADAAFHSNKFLGSIIIGKITTGSLFFVSKKSNVYTASLKLKELKEILENAFRDEDISKKIPKGNGFQVSGLKIKYDMSRPNMDRIVEISDENGLPVDENKTLLIAINGRTVNAANSEFSALKKPEFNLKDLNRPVYEFLIDNLREKGGVVKFELNKRIENINGLEIIVDESGPLDESADE